MPDLTGHSLACTVTAEVQYEPRALHPVGSQVHYLVKQALLGFID